MPKKKNLVAELDDLKARIDQALELLLKARVGIRRTTGLEMEVTDIDNAIAILKPLKGDRED